jgi:hypothetical protein
LNLTDKSLSTFLFFVQGVGILLVGIFLAAYLAGLPTTAVFHSEPAFRIPLAIFGVAVLVLVLATVVVAKLVKPAEE